MSTRKKTKTNAADSGDTKKQKIVWIPLSVYGELGEGLEDPQGEVEIFNKELDVYKSNLITVLMDIVGKEVMRLTQTQRDIIIAHFFRGESTRKLAKTLNISQPGVMDAKSRAINTLRRRLKENPYFLKTFEQLKSMDPPMSVINAIARMLNQ